MSEDPHQCLLNALCEETQTTALSCSVTCLRFTLYIEVLLCWVHMYFCCCFIVESCQLICDPMDCTHGPLCMGLPRQEHWRGLPFPFPWESSEPRDQTWVSCIAGGLLSEPEDKHCYIFFLHWSLDWLVSVFLSFILKSILSKCCYSDFHLIFICTNSLFHTLTFTLCVSLDLKWPL